MTTETKEISTAGDQKKWLGEQTFSLTPRTLDEAMKYADMIAKSSIVPPQFKDKPGDVLVAIQMGMELGVKPLQALQGIAIINGKPTVYGDLALAVVQASPVYAWHKEYESEDGKTSVFEAKRRDSPHTIKATFSDDDAKRAGLTGKSGPWSNYYKRMRQMRARGFGLRDGFADALKGMAIREEVEDYTVLARDGDTEVVKPIAGPTAKTPVQAQVPAPAQEVQPEESARITKVTKSGDKFCIYVGETKFWTDLADVADFAKKLKESESVVEIAHEPEQDGFRKIVEIKRVA